jgi:hypothetical protein
MIFGSSGAFPGFSLQLPSRIYEIRADAGMIFPPSVSTLAPPSASELDRAFQALDISLMPGPVDIVKGQYNNTSDVASVPHFNPSFGCGFK